jgi:hypothetical protein
MLYQLLLSNRIADTDTDTDCTFFTIYLHKKFQGPTLNRSQGTSVNIITGYRLDGWGSIPDG